MFSILMSRLASKRHPQDSELGLLMESNPNLPFNQRAAQLTIQPQTAGNPTYHSTNKLQATQLSIQPTDSGHAIGIFNTNLYKSIEK